MFYVSAALYKQLAMQISEEPLYAYRKTRTAAIAAFKLLYGSHTRTIDCKPQDPDRRNRCVHLSAAYKSLLTSVMKNV